MTFLGLERISSFSEDVMMMKVGFLKIITIIIIIINHKIIRMLMIKTHMKEFLVVEHVLVQDSLPCLNEVAFIHKKISKSKSSDLIVFSMIITRTDINSEKEVYKTFQIT